MSTISEEAARQSSWDRHMDQALAVVAPRPPVRLALAAAAPDDKRALWLTHPPVLAVKQETR